MKHPIRTIIIVALLVKCLYLIMGAIFSPEGIHNWNDLIAVFNRNDAGWYENIATNGYPRIHHIDELGKRLPDGSLIQSSWAFFPAYPMLNRSLMFLFGWSFNGAAFLTSLVLSLVHFTLFYSFAKHFLKDENMALKATILYIVFPFHYHFSMYYTESLFLSALLMAFIGIQQQRLWWSATALIVLVLTRPNGLICLLPVWLYQLEQKGVALRPANFKAMLKNSLFLVPAVMIFAAYLVYQYEMTGYFNAYSIAQKGWNKFLTFPLLALFRGGAIELQFNSVYVILVILFAIYSIRKLPLSLNIFIWINLMMPLCAGSTTSMSRYIAALFPLFLVGCMLVLPKVKKSYILSSSLLLLQLAAFYFWLEWHPLSY
ncbi:hypothetical protein [Edaphocola aurantiacus]|uniref:hypothetical protein n=1 Tax=Edaphocola aurantiacus TaxID=2601682 RepID=UPI001C945D89|nr:hypothetical protein [Edaphocola aurantiacus]